VGEEHSTYHWGDQPANQRLTVAQAAEVLGITEGAVRSRIKRGTLRTTKESGTVLVLLGGGTSQSNQAPNTGAPADQSELLEALRDQIRDLREQLGQANERDRENRRIIAALTSRIPAIEAPQAPSETPSEATEQPGRVEPQPAASKSTRGEDSSPLEAQESHEMHMPEVHGGPREQPSERPWWRRMFGG
jgi:seryl-tRNA synthetase